MNEDNDIQTTFIFHRNPRANLNTCPTISQVHGDLQRKILCRHGNLHRLTDSTFALLRTSEPNYGLLDVTGTVHRTWAAFLCGYPALPHILPQKPHTPRWSIAVHVFRGAAIL
jgi:hypothetical protein